MVGSINVAPPFPGFCHTALPFFSRDLMVVTHEAVKENGEDSPQADLDDGHPEESNPVIISTFPMPDTNDFFSRGGRFGAHNVFENSARPHLLLLRNAGLRHVLQRGRQGVRHERPVPPRGGSVLRATGARGRDENGIMYVVDRLKGGLYILELTL